MVINPIVTEITVAKTIGAVQASCSKRPSGPNPSSLPLPGSYSGIDVCASLSIDYIAGIDGLKSAFQSPYISWPNIAAKTNAPATTTKPRIVW